MTTFVQEVAIADLGFSTGPRVIPRTFDNLPSKGLVNLFRFNDASLSGGLLDAITGAKFLTSGGSAPDGTEQLLPGGGYQVNGWRYLAAPSIPIAAPWAIATTFTRPPPADVSVSAQSVLVIGAIDVNGCDIWGQSLTGEPITAGSALGLYARRTVNGVSQTQVAMPKVWTATYGHPQTLVVRHRGGGVVDIFQRVGTSGVSVLTQLWDMDAIQGASGSRQPLLPVKFGSGGANLMKGSAIYDVAAIYNRPLADEEITAFVLAAEAIAAARGRS